MHTTATPRHFSLLWPKSTDIEADKNEGEKRAHQT